VVEHYLDTVGVTGSNPVSRTIQPRRTGLRCNDRSRARRIRFTKPALNSSIGLPLDEVYYLRETEFALLKPRLFP
jgi:hypothetical protein